MTTAELLVLLREASEAFARQTAEAEATRWKALGAQEACQQIIARLQSAPEGAAPTVVPSGDGLKG